MGLFTFSDGEHERKSNIAIAVCERSLNSANFDIKIEVVSVEITLTKNKAEDSIIISVCLL